MKDKENILGNRIRELRKKHNISQSVLAEQIGCSTPYIGFLEAGKRGGTRDTLRKIAQYFNINEDNFLTLKDQKSITKKITTNNTILVNTNEKHPNSTFKDDVPKYLDDFIKSLSQLDEKIGKHLIEEFSLILKERYFDLLKSYELKELKQVVLSVKRHWLDLVLQNDKNTPSIDMEGYILFDQKIYFQVHLSEISFQVIMLYNNRDQIKHFEAWIGNCSVCYSQEVNIPFIMKPQLVYKFIWFSPHISTIEKFSQLKLNSSDIQLVECNETQLNWYLQNNDVSRKLGS